MADIIAVLQGRHISVEVKTGKGAMRPSQHQHQRDIERAGGIFVLARSVDDVEEALLRAWSVRFGVPGGF